MSSLRTPTTTTTSSSSSSSTRRASSAGLHLPRPPGRGGAAASSSPLVARKSSTTTISSSSGSTIVKPSDGTSTSSSKRLRFPLPPPSPTQRISRFASPHLTTPSQAAATSNNDENAKANHNRGLAPPPVPPVWSSGDDDNNNSNSNIHDPTMSSSAATPARHGQPQSTGFVTPQKLLETANTDNNNNSTPRMGSTAVPSRPPSARATEVHPNSPRHKSRTTPRDTTPAAAAVMMTPSSLSHTTAPVVPETKTTRTVPPTVPEPATTTTTTTTLPEGWVQLQTGDGTPYYYRAADQTTQWTRPNSEEEAVVQSSVSPPHSDAATTDAFMKEESSAAWVAAAAAAAPTTTYTAAEEARIEPESTSTEIATAPSPHNENKADESNPLVAVVPDDTPLPPGWVELTLNDGTLYYYRASDQTTQWTRPTPDWVVPTEPEESETVAPITENLVVVDYEDDDDDVDEDACAMDEMTTTTSQQEEEPLPPGWIKLVTNEGEPYFFRAADQTTQWTRPSHDDGGGDDDNDETTRKVAETAPPVLSTSDTGDDGSQQQPLPPGWLALTLDDGTPYFYHETDGTTQWTRPIATEVDNVGVDSLDAAVAHDDDDKNDDDDNDNVEVDPAIQLQQQQQQQQQDEIGGVDSADSVVDGDEQELPWGWNELQTEDGTPYFYHAESGTTQWARPAALLDETAGEEEPSPLLESAADAGAMNESEVENEVVADETAAATVESAEDDEDFLPPGWTEMRTEDGTAYYYHAEDQLTQWTRPAKEVVAMEPLSDQADATEEELDVSNEFSSVPLGEETATDSEMVAESPSLPPGWVQHATDDGTPYYLYEPDGSTQWERPTDDNDGHDAPPPSSAEDKNVEDVVEDVLPSGWMDEQDTAQPLSAEETVEDNIVEDVLPSGWVELQTDDGTPYYFHEVDQRTSWERPVMDLDGNADVDAASDGGVVEESGELTERIHLTELMDNETKDTNAAVDGGGGDDDDDDDDDNEEETKQQLPEGWEQLETDDGTPYYVNSHDGTAQWNFPGSDGENEAEVDDENERLDSMMPAEEELVDESLVDDAVVEYDDNGDEHSAQLPEGWTQMETDDGTPYYMFEPDGTTQWEWPNPKIEAKETVAHMAAAAAEEEIQSAVDPTPVVEPDEAELRASVLQETQPEEPETPTDHLQLPAGWIKCISEDGTPYFLFEPDGTAQWEPPIVVEADTQESTSGQEELATEEVLSAESGIMPTESEDALREEEEVVPLPPGWVELKTEDGISYYLFEPDGTTQWDRPEATTDQIQAFETVESADSDLINEEIIQKSTPVEGNVPVEEEEEFSQNADFASERKETEEPQHTASVGDSARKEGDMALPHGWIALETEDGVAYYMYEPDGTTQWERPSGTGNVAEPAVEFVGEEEPFAIEDDVNEIEQEENMPTERAGSSALLPTGWVELKTDDGQPYFLYELDGTTQWERPGFAENEIEQPGGPADYEGPEEKELEPEPMEESAYIEPVIDQAESSPSPRLPAGWSLLATDDGTPYYFYEPDGTTQWDAPLETETEADAIEDMAADDNKNALAFQKNDDGLTPAIDTERSPEAEKESQSLPDGWVQLSSDDGTPYYFFEPDGSTQWEPPAMNNGPPRSMGSIPEAVEQADYSESNDETAACANDELPEDWIEIVESSGLTYYRREADGLTQWDRPGTSSAQSIIEESPANDDREDLAATPENTERPTMESKCETIDSSYVLVDDDPQNAELPPGWVEIVDDSTGIPYYLNKEDGSTQWDFPTHGNDPKNLDTSACKGVPQESGSAPEDTGHELDRALPEGWTEQLDPDSGLPYYVEESTGATSWERPSAQDHGVDRSPVTKRFSTGDGSEKAGHRPHAVASFGFGGRLCILRNQATKSNVVAVYRTCRVAPKERVLQIENTKRSRFGIVGPLNLASDELVFSYLDDKATSREDLLWGLISIASRAQGRLRSRDGTSDPDSPENAIVRLLLDYDSKPSQSEAFECAGVMVESNASSLASVENFLLKGEREKAVEQALSTKNFALALLVAAKCGGDYFRYAARCFADEALPPGQPLHTLALQFGGQFDASSWEKIAPEALLEKWRSHLAAIISNRVEGWELTVLVLGDRLLGLGNVMAAHVCYMVCGCSVGRPVSHDSRLTLLGCDLGHQDLFLGSVASIEAFERTEAYEWAKRRGNRGASITSLQSFKIVYATLLADFGLAEAAKEYITSALDCMGISLEDARKADPLAGPLSLSILTFNPNGWLAALASLHDRLVGCPIEWAGIGAPARNDDDTRSTRTEENEADSSFVTARTNIEEFVLSPRPQRGLKKSNVVVDAGPLQPIGEDNVQPEPEYLLSQPTSSTKPEEETGKGKQKPPSLNTAFGQTDAKQTSESPRMGQPKVQTAPMSAPANLENTKKKAPSSTPKSGGLFGIKSWITKRLNPDAFEADLGEGMQAYYDKERKVWVFPGENPADVAAPLPPPPKIASTPAQKASSTGEPKAKSNDPLAAMMAPPSRTPAAARSRAAVRPSPSSMPVMFSPGMTSTNHGDGAPKFAVFQPKVSGGDDGKKENEEPIKSD